MRAYLVLVSFLTMGMALAQPPEFAAASVKRSEKPVGKDYRPGFVANPSSLAVRNASLKSLILYAYGLSPYQVTGPAWLDEDEFDVEGRTSGPVDAAQRALMLRTLLKERFQLVFHTQQKEVRGYALVIDKGGPKLKSAEVGTSMADLAKQISIQLSIPMPPDPTRPGIASGDPVPVIDRTNLPGAYDLSVKLRPQVGDDAFAVWQRVLQEQLGLKLEGEKMPVTFYVVDSALRTPIPN